MTGEYEALADVATGALAARAVDGSGGQGDQAHGGACLNCGTALIGPHCHRCGQNAHVHRTAMALFHDIAHGVFHFEGRIWHTLPLLFWRPGELTKRYVHGERVNFVSPMALFLFSVFLMAATFSWIGGPTGKTNRHVRAEVSQSDAASELGVAIRNEGKLQARRAKLLAAGKSTEDVDEDISEARTEITALRIAGGHKAPAATADDGETDIPKFASGVPGVDTLIGHAKENPGLMAYKLQSAAYKFSWALIPISLPFIWLLFAFRRDVGMYDHAIFATYSLSAMTLAVVVLSIAAAIGVWQAMIWPALLCFPPWHMYRQLKGAYQIGRFGAMWRMVALLFAASTSALIFFIFLLTMGVH